MLIEHLIPYLPTQPFLFSLSVVGILIIVSLIAFWITEKIINNILAKMFRKTITKLDDILVNRNIFNRLAYIVPALLIVTPVVAVPLKLS